LAAKTWTAREESYTKRFPDPPFKTIPLAKSISPHSRDDIAIPDLEMEKDRVLAALQQQIELHRQEWCQNPNTLLDKNGFVIAVDSAVRFAASLLKQEPDELLGLFVPRVIAYEEAETVLCRQSSIRNSSVPQQQGKVDRAETTPVRNNFYSNQSLAGLPDVLLRKILGFLQTKEKISASAVSRRWHTLAYQSVNFVRFQADDDGFGAKPNQALLFGARNFHFIQKVSLRMSTFLRADGEPSSYIIGLLLDNFFGSVPKLQGACLDFQNCRSVDIESITRGAGGFRAIARHETLNALLLLCPRFTTMEQVVEILQPLQDLRSLDLHCMTFSGHGDNWPSTMSFVTVVNGMKKIQRLSLINHFLSDEKIAHMLSGGSQELVTVVLATRYMTLSDQSLQALANNCPRLKFLDITHQKDMSLPGIQRCLQSCPIQTLLSSLPSFHFKGMALASPHLLFHLSTLQNDTSYPPEESHIRHTNAATLACDGRVVFMCRGHDGRVYDPTTEMHLPDPVWQRQSESFRIVEKASTLNLKDIENLEFHDRWDAFL
jgi:hypothetical protein